jgi:predicted small lipoprotein YifL
MINSINHFASRRRGRHLMLWCMVFAALLLGACGKKGPLYLPKEGAAVEPGIQSVSPMSALFGKN